MFNDPVINQFQNLNRRLERILRNADPAMRAMDNMERTFARASGTIDQTASAIQNVLNRRRENLRRMVRQSQNLNEAEYAEMQEREQLLILARRRKQELQRERRILKSNLGSAIGAGNVTDAQLARQSLRDNRRAIRQVTDSGTALIRANRSDAIDSFWETVTGMSAPQMRIKAREFFSLKTAMQAMGAAFIATGYQMAQTFHEARQAGASYTGALSSAVFGVQEAFRLFFTKGILLTPSEAGRIQNAALESRLMRASPEMSNMVGSAANRGANISGTTRLLQQLDQIYGYQQSATEKAYEDIVAIARSSGLEGREGLLINEVSKNSHLLANSMNRTAGALAKANMEAMRLGVNIKTFETFGNRMTDDFETFLDAQARLQIFMPGIDLTNALLASQYGNEGDISKALQSVFAGRDIGRLPRSVRRMVSTTMGMSELELVNLSKGANPNVITGSASPLEDKFGQDLSNSAVKAAAMLISLAGAAGLATAGLAVFGRNAVAKSAVSAIAGAGIMSTLGRIGGLVARAGGAIALGISAIDIAASALDKKKGNFISTLGKHGWTLGGAAAGAGVGAFFGGVGAIPGALIGASIGGLIDMLRDFSGAGKYHSGGVVSGRGRSSDEVPAILQKGEVVLSRTQVSGLNKLITSVQSLGEIGDIAEKGLSNIDKLQNSIKSVVGSGGLISSLSGIFSSMGGSGKASGGIGGILSGLLGGGGKSSGGGLLSTIGGLLGGGSKPSGGGILSNISGLLGGGSSGGGGGLLSTIGGIFGGNNSGGGGGLLGTVSSVLGGSGGSGGGLLESVSGILGGSGGGLLGKATGLLGGAGGIVGKAAGFLGGGLGNVLGSVAGGPIGMLAGLALPLLEKLPVIGKAITKVKKVVGKVTAPIKGAIKKVGKFFGGLFGKKKRRQQAATAAQQPTQLAAASAPMSLSNLFPTALTATGMFDGGGDLFGGASGYTPIFQGGSVASATSGQPVATGPVATTNADVVAKLDELLKAWKALSINVQLDGRKVGDGILAAYNRG